jgi:hypothetical protein
VRGVEALGQVIKTENRTQAVSTETKVSERVVTRADETAPAVVQPVVETPVATSVAQPTVAAPPVVLPVVDPDLVVPAGSGWALLPSLLTANATYDGTGPVGPFAAGGLSDPNGRTLGYSATGLPAGVNIDPLTGVISGTYTVTGFFPVGQTFTDYVVQLRAAASGSGKALSKIVTLRFQFTCPTGTALVPEVGACA